MQEVGNAALGSGILETANLFNKDDNAKRTKRTVLKSKMLITAKGVQDGRNLLPNEFSKIL